MFSNVCVLWISIVFQLILFCEKEPIRLIENENSDGMHNEQILVSRLY